MATGDITAVVIGVFDYSDIAAGVNVGAATNVGTQPANTHTSENKYIDVGHGQVLVINEAWAA